MSEVQVKSTKPFTGLEWLVGEIESSLHAAFNELESFTQNTNDETKIRFCLGHIHQINGPFKMLECAGCVLLVEEMEALAQAIIAKKVSNVNEACEILVQAIIKLPIYLRHILAHREDRPETLILLLNDLRAAQGQALISEGILFSPDLSMFSANEKVSASEKASPKAANPAASDFIKRLRQVYQLSLIKVIKGEEKEKNYANLIKVMLRMQELSKGDWRQHLWAFAEHVLHLVEAREVSFSLALKKLFRTLDGQLKAQAKEADSGERSSPDLGLLKNLLYYLSTSQPDSAALTTIWHEHKLADAFPSGKIDPDGGALMLQYDPSVVKAVVSSIQGELATVRSALERYSIEGGLSADQVRDSLPILHSMADSLALVGQGKLRDAMRDSEKNLRQIFSADGSGIDDEDVIAAVQRLAQIDFSLNTWGANPDKFSQTIDLDTQQNQYEFSNASQMLLAESRTTIERIKEAVVAFINSQWDLQLLSHLPAMFAELHGALNIIGLTRAAAVISACSKYVQDIVVEQSRTVEWHALDTFADAITIVEYYIEQFDSHSDTHQEDVLIAAEESIYALLDERAKSAFSSSLEKDDSAEDRAQPEEIIAEIASRPLELDTVDDGAISIEEASVADNEAAATDLQPASENILETTTDNSESDDEFDDEIVDIFVEEASEVLQNVNQLLPEWKEQPQSKETLAIIRRAFHTLKGSGRMVGAEDVGALAWSVEDMFNRVLDGRINLVGSMVALTDRVLEQLPALIESFAEKRITPDAEYNQALIACAEAFAKGEALDLVPDRHQYVGLVQEDSASNQDNSAIEVAAEDAGQGSADQDSPAQDSLSQDSLSQDSTAVEFVAEAAAEGDLTASTLDDASEEEPVVESLEPLTDLSKQAAESNEETAEDEAAEAEGIEEEPAAADERYAGDDHEAILLDMFVHEAQGHLKTLDEFVLKTQSMAPLYQPPSLAVQRALHTLKGTAQMADFEALGELVAPLEEFVKALYHHAICLDADIVCLIEDGVSLFRNTLNSMVKGETIVSDGAPLFLARLEELRYKSVGHLLYKTGNHRNDTDFSAVKNLMASGLLALQNYPEFYDYLQRQTAPPKVVFHEILSDLNDINTQLKQVDIKPILELSQRLAEIYQLLQSLGQTPSAQVIELMKASHENLLNLFDMLAADQDLCSLEKQQKDNLTAVHRQLTEALAEKQQREQQLATDAAVTDSISTTDPVNSTAHIEALAEKEVADTTDDELGEDIESDATANDANETLTEEQSDDFDVLLSASDPVLEDLTPTTQPEKSAPPRILIDVELDKDIIGVFVEEADDIVSSIEESVVAWRSNPTQIELADRLKRDLHTLKGGARMSGFRVLGDVAHAIESLIEGTSTYNGAFFRALVSHQESLVGAYDIVRRIAQGGDIAALRQQMETLLARPAETQTAQNDENSVESFIQSLAPALPVNDQRASPSKEVAGKSAAQTSPDKPFSIQGEIKEVVRIGAEVLDTLVNLSGENIIFRGRVEEQLSEFNQFLDEMDATVERLQEQVRRLGTETEAQIEYRREQIEASGDAADFDPLEMDRYSHLQQLTGSLMESASDLRDLKETLNEKLSGTETLLLHQSRINTDLQEGLMKTRMVPFARVVPRLRRIVRQVAMELGKKVELRMDNIHGEMDRAVLDRMIAPLEHMIRNAIDHGIETEEQRLQAGKPAVGTIAITTYRKGGDIVIHLADDGRGLDVAKIRQVAIDRDLILESAALSDHEIAQFIFHPGFSTSDQVSQISGRGVGMDVVNSEVRQCGGTVDIETVAGQGAQFTVVLPFTLSVNRALMINVSGDHYALSLNAIDGVCYMPDSVIATAEGAISYAGSRYELCYLGTLLDSDAVHRPDNLEAEVALVLFHSDNRRFAVQVDDIVGTREIVVKTLGPQFSAVPGLGGATILSDGQVVVILDLNELARVAIKDLTAISQTDTQQIEQHTPARHPLSVGISPCILVVDDSVTVRKVTSRILRRQGYQVITAKDGIDALKTLQEQIPAAILLDIEMPRMDGFEVAARVRASEELKHIPIVMITSRTGDKHRERALELGVDQYMGKPYQEEQLLDTLNELLTVPN